MSPDAIAVTGLCLTLLGVLIMFVWNAAKTATSHDHRLGSLEKGAGETDTAIDRLTSVVNRLDRHLYAAEKLQRASQGQFDEGSDRPPKE